MEMNKKSQNLTLWTWADRGQYLSTFEGVGGYVDPIWGELEQKKPQNQLFLRYFFRFSEILRYQLRFHQWKQTDYDIIQLNGHHRVQGN